MCVGMTLMTSEREIAHFPDERFSIIVSLSASLRVLLYYFSDFLVLCVSFIAADYQSECMLLLQGLWSQVRHRFVCRD